LAVGITTPREHISDELVDISVLIPTRNRAAYLPVCLRSLSEQTTDPDIEVLVVDNGSTDATADVLAGWSRRDIRIRSIYEARPGRSAALNAGIRAASGRVLLFTDDDVIAQPTWIRAFREFFASNDDARLLAGGPILNVPSDLQPWPGWLGIAPSSEVGSLDHGQEMRPLETHEPLWGANMAAHAELFRQLGGWDESLGVKAEQRGTYEDLEFQGRVRAAGGTVWYVPGAVIHHRVDSANVTPRSVLYRAFHAGMSSSAWDRHHGQAQQEASLIRVAMSLTWHLATWMAIAALLHLVRPPGTVQRGRRAAWHAGRDVGLVDGFASSPSDGRFLARALRAVVRRTAFGLVARLAPSR
jgi:GT2 family glycosyltransferase